MVIGETASNGSVIDGHKLGISKSGRYMVGSFTEFAEARLYYGLCGSDCDDAYVLIITAPNLNESEITQEVSNALTQLDVEVGSLGPIAITHSLRFSSPKGAPRDGTMNVRYHITQNGNDDNPILIDYFLTKANMHNF